MDVKAELRTVAAIVREAKARPTTLFEQAIYDVREHLKKQKKELATRAANSVAAKLKSDLTGKGFLVVGELKASLGKFRGSHFITSCKLFLRAQPSFKEGDTRLLQAVAYLQQNYSPKFRVKSVDENGVAAFNVR